MLITTKGIVLHSTKYSDTSLIVKLFTEKRGVQSFIVKGAFSKKSRFRASIFSPMALVSATYDDHHNDRLKYFKDISRLDTGMELSFDPARSAILLFYNELLYKLLFESGEDEVLFHFLEEEIAKVFEEDIELTDLPLRFLLRLSIILGFFPENNYSESNCYFSLSESKFQSYLIDEKEEIPKEESLYLSLLLRNNSPVAAPRHTRNNLLHYLIKYYKTHNEQIRDIESAEILASVLH